MSSRRAAIIIAAEQLQTIRSGIGDELPDDIVEFMKALTDKTIDSPFIDPTVPATVPSGIPPVEIIEPFSLVPLPEHTSEAQ